MAIKAVLFDLDGTLLPMEQSEFIKGYFGGLTRRLVPCGYAPEAVVDGIWKGTAAMVKNTGEMRNEDVFWEAFVGVLGERVREDIPVFDAFYREDFPSVKAFCGFDERARVVIDTVKQKGLRAVLATNPLFPSIATENRILWAGLKPEDFEFFTTYENSFHCKPNLDYYRDVLSHIGHTPEECVMVGNDVDEDMIARELGMQVFLLTPCLINKRGADITEYPNGGFDELIEYLQKL